MLRFFAYFLVLFFITDTIQAQLVSWRDLIEGDLPSANERIQYGPDSLQFGELWLPLSEPRATVVLIHGGCWLDIYPGTEIMNHMAHALRNEGFAVWNIEYRRLGHEGGGYPGTFQDVAAGADYLSVIGEEYQLPMDIVIASGHSAGGHLATWLAARKNIPESSELYSASPLKVHGVISLAGINDLERYASYGSSSCGDQTVERLVNMSERGDEAYNDTSPRRLLPLGVPHMEVNAELDAPVPPFFGYHFKNAANEAGDSTLHMVLSDSGHFEMIAPWSDQWNRVLNLFKIITFAGS
ncbi:MAG: alpha/beta hydrolase [Balneolaceae bacterium]|nr:alpha/beta hydrolase [Balneolaceae bacterium]